jgi:uridine phosphorylase
LSSNKSWYLKCKAENIADKVVLVGDPARVQLFASQMDDSEVVAQEREFTTLTGIYKKTPLSVISIGIGAPSAAIVMEELWELGVKVVVRAGTAIALNVPVGTFILANGGIRYEGTSPTYLPIEYPAVCDPELLFAYREMMSKENAHHATGLLATSDGFYTHLFEHTLSRRMQSERPSTLLKQFTQHGVLGADMETSAVYTVGYYLGLKVLSVLIATVDGKNNTMLETSLRKEKEKELASLVLKGLDHYAQSN